MENVLAARERRMESLACQDRLSGHSKTQSAELGMDRRFCHIRNPKTAARNQPQWVVSR